MDKSYNRNVIYGAFGREKQEDKKTGAGKETLGELVADWNTNINYVRNARTTWLFTENIQKHIFSFFHTDCKIKDVTSKDIIEYMAFLKKDKGLSSNTINKHRTHLMTLFEYAVMNEEVFHIQVNPVRKVKPLKPEPYTYHIYQPEEAREVLEKLRKEENSALEVAVSLALCCGCRREEVCALRWENVDMHERIITICEVRTTAGKEVVKMKHTKNNMVRQVGIPDMLYDVLKRAKQVQKKNREKAGKGKKYKDLDFVLCEDDGSPWHPNNVTKRWERFARANDLRYIRYHDLRHTNLSLLMTRMSAVDVAKLGGHKKVSTTTNIYGHSFNNAIEKGRQTMNELL